MAPASQLDQRPLAGVTVLDLTRFLAGPFCGRVLADLGAEVIKVEPPEGDNTRKVRPVHDGVSTYFSQANAGKRSVCVDLGRPEGVELVRRAAEAADVVVENFRPGVAERLGVGAAELRGRNPRLVYCSISGYGQDGPWAQRGAFAPLVQAESGTIEFAARKRGTAPLPEAQSHGDVYPGLMAANAILAALVQRGVTGEGQHVDVSMAEVLLYTNEWTSTELEGFDEAQLFGGWNALIAEVGDGRMVAFPGNPAVNFPTWARAMGREDLLSDPRYASSVERLKRRDELVPYVREFVASFPDAEELEAALAPHRMPMGVLRSMAEIAETPWAAHRRVFATTAQGARIPRSPYRSSASDIGAAGETHRRGEDNLSVLGALCGLDADEVAKLTADGVLSSET